MSRFDRLFKPFFTLYVTISVVLLLLGLGPALAKAVPAVQDAFVAWGDGGLKGPNLSACVLEKLVGIPGRDCPGSTIEPRALYPRTM